MEKAVKGFKTTGIYPFNPEVFADDDFLPAEVTDVAEEQTTEQPVVARNLPESPQSDTEPGNQNPQPSCSHVPFKNILFEISPKPISNAREKDKKSGKRANRAQHAEELTSSPFKDELIAKEANKKQNVKSLKRKFTDAVPKKRKNIRKKEPVNVSSSDSEEEDSDTICIYCTSKYRHSKAGEGWIQCQNCKGWAHDACGGVSEHDEEFICLLCS
ncbi:zinc finger fyve/phd-type [Holotrichia oblita]|uniref:Zinc finger fyve/phd-type n=1 Tax=Holotrichia oblita TaxID=644536 RepID=A0ACB9SKL4_HOLOL|nr:zinc finger fyve/phd-type [Holotrichia oblita]